MKNKIAKVITSLVLVCAMSVQLCSNSVSAAADSWTLYYNSNSPSSEHVKRVTFDNYYSTRLEIKACVNSYSGNSTTKVFVYNYNTGAYIINSVYGYTGGYSTSVLKKTNRKLKMQAEIYNYASGVSKPSGKFVY